jgi:hypothetical protein
MTTMTLHVLASWSEWGPWADECDPCRGKNNSLYTVLFILYVYYSMLEAGQHQCLCYVLFNSRHAQQTTIQLSYTTHV